MPEISREQLKLHRAVVLCVNFVLDALKKDVWEKHSGQYRQVTDAMKKLVEIKYRGPRKKRRVYAKAKP